MVRKDSSNQDNPPVNGLFSRQDARDGAMLSRARGVRECAMLTRGMRMRRRCRARLLGGRQDARQPPHNLRKSMKDSTLEHSLFAAFNTE